MVSASASVSALAPALALPPVVAQLEPAAGGLLAYLGTFVVATVFYGLTLHIAARYVLGDVSVRRAFRVAPILALFLIVLQQAGPAITAGVSLVVAYTAIHVIYDLSHRMTAFVTVIYYTVALLVGIVIYNLVFLIGQAPG